MFVGGTNRIKADSWIDITKKNLRGLFVPHHRQVKLATCMHQEETSYWWKSMEKITFHRLEISSIMWVKFMSAFDGQYFPKPVVLANLVQGEDSVQEYVKKFLRLEHFAPLLLATKKARANKFF